MSPQPMSEAVMAYVDGELQGAERERFEAALAGDAALRERVERERRLRAALTKTYAPVLDEPVPDRLNRLLDKPALRSEAKILDLAAAPVDRETRSTTTPREAANDRHWLPRHWGAMAACLVLGLALGLWRPGAAPGGGDAATALVASDGSRLVAGGALERQLTAGLAADPAPGGAVRVGLSFAARDGGYCRSFALDAPAGGSASAGIACRDGGAAGDWTVRALAPATATTGDYRMAATALPPSLLSLVDQLREGEVLDATAERAARDKGWRR